MWKLCGRKRSPIVVTFSLWKASPVHFLLGRNRSEWNENLFPDGEHAIVEIVDIAQKVNHIAGGAAIDRMRIGDIPERVSFPNDDLLV